MLRADRGRDRRDFVGSPHGTLDRAAVHERLVGLEVDHDIVLAGAEQIRRLIHAVGTRDVIGSRPDDLRLEPARAGLDLTAVRRHHDVVEDADGRGGAPAPLEQGAAGKFLEELPGDTGAVESSGKDADHAHRRQV